MAIGKLIRPASDQCSFVRQASGLLLLISTIALIVFNLPNRVWDVADTALIVSLGPLAVWRYGWWFLHLVRANIYASLVFPKLRKRADAVWSSGWRPPFVHFLVPTFKERPEITEAMLESIFAECRASGVPARIFVVTGDVSDELVIEDYCSNLRDLQADVIMVRQNQPGKRIAMGLGLRAMSRYGVGPNDLAVFVDGDSILGDGTLERCAPLFHLNPRLGAVTTDESAIVNGPGWMQAWHDMRFAQRRLAMESHSLSRKVLTLTGRLSIFRAAIVVEEDFVRTVEADYLDHWLWGRFRFLSGDDKSTWFSLLRKGYQMLYVPDASVLTIETIDEHPYERVQQNLMRWSGNMLRNGSRALALGPSRCGVFIWWCVLDQRLSIWTSLSGLVMALALSLVTSFHVLLAYLIWVLLTRTLVSIVLYFYAGRIYPSFTFLLYVNQMTASAIKVHLLFRVSKQRWLNRGDQRTKVAGSKLLAFQNAMAAFLTTLYVGIFVFLACFKAGVAGLGDTYTSWAGWLRMP
jgi:glycosyltransferase Alg8